jgi:hypothetical protein
METVPGRAEAADMAAPPWLAGAFAALAILIAACSASRLAISPLRQRSTDWDADGLHAVMGAAMAGMLVPRLDPLPGVAWAAAFAIAAAWFGWRALRLRVPGRYPVPHLVECAAMIYMLVPARHPSAVGTMAMPMAAGSAGFPALAIVLALFMLGSIVWTADRMASRARPGPPAPGPALAPRLAAVSTIAMSVTMGYMLVLMA